MPDANDFCNLRNRCNLSQFQLAVKFGCSPSYIYKTERGDWGMGASSRALRDSLWKWLTKYAEKLEVKSS